MQPSAEQVADQGEGLGDVVVVVRQRVGHRVRHDDLGGAVDGRRDVRVVGEDPVEQRGVGDVALVRDPTLDELAPTGAEVVQDHRA